MTDVAQLEALARAATPGPWTKHKGTYIYGGNGRVVTPKFRRQDSDAAIDRDFTYIAAANPAVILALIERVRAAEAALADIRDACDGHEDADGGIPNLASPHPIPTAAQLDALHKLADDMAMIADGMENSMANGTVMHVFAKQLRDRLRAALKGDD